MSARTKPRFPNAFDNLFDAALAAAQVQDLRRAADLFGRAVEVEPNHAPAHCNRATVLSQLNQWEAALVSFDRALSIDPGYAVAWSNRGNVLKDLRRWSDALASYDRAIARNPQLAEAHSNRGAVLKELNRLDEALASYDAALAQCPTLAEAHSNRGIVLAALGHFDAALASYDRALSLRPSYAQAHSNRGMLLHELGHLATALASYDCALAFEPNLPQARYNRSMTQLAMGDFTNGWVEHEWRWLTPDSERGRFEQAPWLGAETIAGKVVLLHAEQGLGDALQFCRYAKRVADLGATVILESPSGLARLMASLEGLTQVVARGAPLPRFDYHCPLMSLPLAFHTTLATIPAEVPYLRCSSDQVAAWEDRLGSRTRLRVGLVWSGGFRPERPATWPVNQRRNIPLVRFAALKHPSIDFYSLQKGQPAESELDALAASNWPGPTIINHTRELRDFSDTAAFIQNLDLVISVDTSTAHLAGALGKPIWILNRFDSCWRWLRDRADTPWYPTARLYRQATPGDWDGVIQRVARDLAQLAESRSHKS
jgi:tetratricopeptide (TPR) repeat protein